MKINKTNVARLLDKAKVAYQLVPYEVDEFLQSQSEHLKGVVVSGDTGYGEAYCKAGDVIAEQYNVPCLYKVENDGSDEDIEAIKKVIA